MVSILQEKIEDIPCLVVVQEDRINEPLPLLMYYHGYTSAKEHNLPLAFLLAEEGYRVVLPDSLYHGERSEENLSSNEMNLYFWDVVIKNVQEIKVLKTYFEQKELLLDDRVGIAGTSMGGITTSAALTQYPWITSAAVLMGSPKIRAYAKELITEFSRTGYVNITDKEEAKVYQTLKPYDLSTQVDTLRQRPLLFWHGQKDKIVPFDHSYAFYNEVKSAYENKSHIRFLKEDNGTHKVTRYAILETVSWFKKHL